ncbi:MAG: hypothetical protein OIF58_04435, partial [Cohaesibacter sp.]|nr:hypothetical protein [Cohaesibacter sp.]
GTVHKLGTLSNGDVDVPEVLGSPYWSKLALRHEEENPCFDITSLTRCRQNVSKEKQMTFGGHL